MILKCCTSCWLQWFNEMFHCSYQLLGSLVAICYRCIQYISRVVSACFHWFNLLFRYVSSFTFTVKTTCHIFLIFRTLTNIMSSFIIEKHVRNIKHSYYSINFVIFATILVNLNVIFIYFNDL